MFCVIDLLLLLTYMERLEVESEYKTAATIAKPDPSVVHPQQTQSIPSKTWGEGGRGLSSSTMDNTTSSRSLFRKQVVLSMEDQEYYDSIITRHSYGQVTSSLSPEEVDEEEDDSDTSADAGDIIDMVLPRDQGLDCNLESDFSPICYNNVQAMLFNPAISPSTSGVAIQPQTTTSPRCSSPRCSSSPRFSSSSSPKDSFAEWTAPPLFDNQLLRNQESGGGGIILQSNFSNNSVAPL